MTKTPKIESSWLEVLEDEFQKDYFKEIKQFLVNDVEQWITIYPPMNNIFDAFKYTPFDKVKVVILWQDPYHWPNQAHWLSFSVPKWVTPPPSLKNIFKEINNDIWWFFEDNQKQLNWNLEKWANEWVFMLNAILTVQKWNPASHSKIWWETFTDAVIKTISDKKNWVVFLLWWNFAKSKIPLIDTFKHSILTSTHPSPFSAYNWFFWSEHFSKTNKILKEMWKDEINWRL